MSKNLAGRMSRAGVSRVVVLIVAVVSVAIAVALGAMVNKTFLEEAKTVIEQMKASALGGVGP